jgi:hypothetical protein
MSASIVLTGLRQVTHAAIECQHQADAGREQATYACFQAKREHELFRGNMKFMSGSLSIAFSSCDTIHPDDAASRLK